MTTFIAEELSLDQAAAVQPVLARIARVDRHLADQLRRSVQSVALNLAEGSGRTGGDRTHCFRIALGSHREVRTALRLAVCHGYVGAAQLETAERIHDRLSRMLWSLAKM